MIRFTEDPELNPETLSEKEEYTHERTPAHHSSPGSCIHTLTQSFRLKGNVKVANLLLTGDWKRNQENNCKKK